MKRWLIAALLLLVPCSQAQRTFIGGTGRDFIGGTGRNFIAPVVTVTCATTDIPAAQRDEFYWGAESGDSETLTAGGTADCGTDDTAYNTSALTTGKGTGLCDLGWQWTLNSTTAGSEFEYFDTGTLIAETVTKDVYFSLYFQELPAEGERFSIGYLGELNTAAGATAAYVEIRTASGVTTINASSATDSSQETIIIGTWYDCVIHLDATAASCFLQVGGGAQRAFTRTARGVEFIAFGAVDGKGAADSATYVVDAITMATP